MAFIDTPIGEFFNSITASFHFLDKLGEGLNDLIISDIPAHEQHQMRLRIRQTKHHCRIMKYDYPMVCNIVKINFQDQTVLFQEEVAKEICFELKINATPV